MKRSIKFVLNIMPLESTTFCIFISVQSVMKTWHLWDECNKLKSRSCGLWRYVLMWYKTQDMNGRVSLKSLTGLCTS